MTEKKLWIIGFGKQGEPFSLSSSYLCINLELFIYFVFPLTSVDLQNILIWNVYL